MSAAEAQSVWIALSDRPEWADVQPVCEDADTDVPVVSIAYEAKDAEVLGYFYAVLAADEKSHRVLNLTEEVIKASPANYTAWDYRWECVRALDADLQSELRFIDNVAAVNVKNYQLWNHRRRCALALGAAQGQKELEYAHQCLAVDAKNYHAWAHRQALVQEFGLWEQELAYVTDLIEDDVRNNSAWNQRLFVVSQMPDRSARAEEALEEELPHVTGKIRLCPNNESAWAFLRGLLALPGCSHLLALDPCIPQLCSQVLEAHPSCTHAWAMLADSYAARATAVLALADRPSTAASINQATPPSQGPVTGAASSRPNTACPASRSHASGLAPDSMAGASSRMAGSAAGATGVRRPDEAYGNLRGAPGTGTSVAAAVASAGGCNAPANAATTQAEGWSTKSAAAAQLASLAAARAQHCWRQLMVADPQSRNYWRQRSAELDGLAQGHAGLAAA